MALSSLAAAMKANNFGGVSSNGAAGGFPVSWAATSPSTPAQTGIPMSAPTTSMTPPGVAPGSGAGIQSSPGAGTKGGSYGFSFEEGGAVPDEDDQDAPTQQAIPAGGGGFDPNNALDIVNQVLHFGRQQSGLISAAPAQTSAIPQGYEEGGAVEEDPENLQPDEAQNVPQEAAQEAIPVDENGAGGEAPAPQTQQAPSDPKKIVSYLQGAGAAPAGAVKGLEAATGEEQPAVAKLAAVNKAMEDGGVEQAWRVLQSYRQQHDLQNTLAKVKLQQGNIAAAAQAATEADANVLDGTQTHFSPAVGGNGVTATVTRIGSDTPFQHIKMGLQQFGNFLNSLYDAKLESGTAVALQKAGVTGGDPAFNNMDLSKGTLTGGMRKINAGFIGASEAYAPQQDDEKTEGGETSSGAEPPEQKDTNSKMLNPPALGAPQPGSFNPLQARTQLADLSQKRGTTQPRQTTMEDDRRAAAEKIYGKEAVDAAYQQFPGINDNRARAKFLNEERAKGKEYTSQENQAAHKFESAKTIAQIRADASTHNNENTNAARRYGVDRRFESTMAGVEAKLQQTGQQVDDRKMKLLGVAITNNPQLAKDPAAALKYYTDLQAGLPKAPAAPARQQSPQQQAAPQRKFYNGKWYIRGPNGQPVEDTNQQ